MPWVVERQDDGLLVYHSGKYEFGMESFPDDNERGAVEYAIDQQEQLIEQTRANLRGLRKRQRQLQRAATRQRQIT